MEKKLLFAILTFAFWISLTIIFCVFMPNLSFPLIPTIIIMILVAVSTFIAARVILIKIFNY